MKKFTYIITMAFMAATVSASAQVGVMLPKAPLLAGTPNNATPVASFNPIPVALQQGMTNILFYEDFANGFAGNNGVGSWTAEDTGGGLIWQAVNEAGDGYFADGTASGVHPPAGEFSTNIGTLNSTTAANGWMVFDCDYYNTPISDGYENTEGWITSPSLDFGNVGSVSIAWDQYFRYCCYPYAPIYLQVSSDGGASWTTFDAHGIFIESANTASANPLPTVVDISCAAAYQSNVLIRFSYLQPPETGDAYSHYYWGIDDVTIYENFVSNDLEAVLLTNGDIDNTFEYRVTPMEQVVSQADGGVLAGLRYKNNGVSDQSATVLIEVLDSNGIVVSETSESLGVVSAPANSVICPDPSFESVYVSTGWVPEGPGTYTLRASISSDSGEDSTPENNVISKTMVFTDYEMGHDDEDALDTELTPQDSDIEGLYNPCGYGSFFQMQNSGSVAYGVAVRFGPNSGVGDLDFETRLYTVDAEVGLTDSPFESAYWEYNDAWTPDSTGNGEYVYLPFVDPIELTTEDFYFLGVINEFESEAQLTVLGNANSDTDGSTGDYSMSGAGDFVWFTSQTATPAIRLVLSPEPFTYPGCTDLTACNYDPDAEEDDGSCEYETCTGCMDVEACNYDELAIISDSGSCVYPTEFIDCDGNCSDPNACNYGGWETTYVDGFETQSAGMPLDPSEGWYQLFPNESTSHVVSSSQAYEGNQSIELTPLPDGADVDFNLLLRDWQGDDVYVEYQMFVGEAGESYVGFFWDEPEVDANNNFLYNEFWQFVLSGNELSIVTIDTGGSLGSFDANQWISLGYSVNLDEEIVFLFVNGEIVATYPTPAGADAFNGTLYWAAFQPGSYMDSYVEQVNQSPGACTYPGCDDPSAANYDALAGCAGECVYLAYDCSSVGDDAWSNEAMGLFPDWQEAMHGVPWEGEWVFNVPATMIEPGSGVSYGVHHVDWLGMEGMPDWATATSFGAGEAMGASTQHCIAAFGTPTLPGMHAITATGEVFISIFGQPFSIGEQSFSATLEVMANPNPIPGCTYPHANNYLSYATLDDGGCEYWGCTDAEAANFNPFANVDDGSCGEACDPSGDSTCQADNDGDGVITVTDLLILLGEFGAECE